MRSPFSWLCLTVPTALITGVTGQDGSYLAQLLVSQGYRVIGTTRNMRTTLQGPQALPLAGVELVEGALDSPESVVLEVLKRERPDEVYHLAGPSRVAASWNDPVGTQIGIVLSTALLVNAVLESLPSPRVFLAGTCEVFAPQATAQDEGAPLGPTSPYGQAKLEAMNIVRHAREKFGLYAVTGILFNHESPRRGEDFVTKRIAHAAARIARGEKRTLTLGNLAARRDWGFAGDTVRAMWLMMFQDEPGDLVIGTGVAHSVGEFCDAAFLRVGLDWREHVSTDPTLIRPGDAALRLANPARARERLRWTPEVDFKRLVEMMVDHELQVES